MDLFRPGGPGGPPEETGSERIGSPPETLDSLRREVERHRLLIEVLVRALIEKGIYTREQLNALANLIDMEDGVRDGRRRTKKGLEFCSVCGRTLMSKMGSCLYCGHEEVLDIL